MDADEDDDVVPPPDPEVIEEEEEDEEEDDRGGSESARLCELMSNVVFNGFEKHVRDLEVARERRREALAFKSAIEDGAMPSDENSAKQTQDDIDGLGVRLPSDEFQGDVNYRTLQKLLARVDARGYERSAQQLEFHVVRDDQLKPCLFSIMLACVGARRLS